MTYEPIVESPLTLPPSPLVGAPAPAKRGLRSLRAWVATLLAASTLAAVPAYAGMGGSVVPAFPTPLNVGDIKTASITITNRSTRPNDTENVNVSRIMFTPSCGRSDGFSCSIPDPGVFKFGTVIGRSGTSCAGTVFSLGPVNPDTGEFELIAPSSKPVVLGPANDSGPLPKQCIISINFQLVREPIDSTPGDAQPTTDSLARASLQGAGTSNSGSASGGSTSVVNPLLPPPSPGAVTVSNTAFGSYVGSPFVLATSFSSDISVSGCEYTTNGGGSWQAATISGSAPNFTCTKTGIAGTNGQSLTLNMRATNANGIGTAIAIATVVDTAAPSTTSNAVAGWFGADQVVTLTPTDAGSGIASTTYCTDATNTCTPGTSGTTVNVSCAAGAVCQTYVRFRSTDNLGNVEPTKSAQVSIDKSSPTNGTLNATAGNAQNVLTWSGSSDTGSGVSQQAPYTLVFAIGSSPANCNSGTTIYTGTATTFTHTGLAGASNYFYRLCTTDAVGNTSAGATANASPAGNNKPPTANAGVAQTTTVNTTITLDGSGSSDPDGTIANYAWTFGDGGSANAGTSPTTTHAYAAQGVYTAILTVTDNQGAKATASVQITVNPPAQVGGAYRWGARFGGASTASLVPYSTAIDSSGNVIVAGVFWGTVNLGGGSMTSAGGSDIFVAKYSSTGAHIWSKRFGSNMDDAAQAVAVDASGNVYLGGSFKGTVNFGGSALTASYSGFGSQMRDAFLVKFNSSGVHQWSKSIGSTSDDAIFGLATDSTGSVIATGTFAGLVNFGGTSLTSNTSSPDIFLAKYAGDGSLTWTKRFGNNGADVGYGVAVDGSDNIVITGAFYGDIDFGGGTLSSNGTGSSDVFVAKFTSAGAHVWSKRFGGDSQDIGYAVAVDSTGNAFVTGYVQGTVDFGGGSILTHGSLDAFIVKYSPTGTHLWSRALGGLDVEEGLGIATDPNGNVVLVGTFAGDTDFGTGSLSSNGYSWDVIVAKYSPTGTPVWVKQFGDSGDDFAYAVKTDPSGNIAVVGTFQGQIDFGGGLWTASGWTDMFVVNLAP
jgi:hypothetical protein